MKDKNVEFIQPGTEERKNLVEIRRKRDEGYKSLFKVTEAKNLTHQAKLNAVRDRILEACEEYKTHLAERIYFAKIRPFMRGLPDAQPSWKTHPNMTELKEGLDNTTIITKSKMRIVLLPNETKIIGDYEATPTKTIYDTEVRFAYESPNIKFRFTPQGINLIKKYCALNELVKQFSELLNVENVKLETLLNFKLKAKELEPIFLKKTNNEGLGFFKLNHETGEAYFAFFAKIWQLIKSIFQNPSSQRFLEGIANVSIDAPTKVKDFRFSCTENKNGEIFTKYAVPEIFSI